MKALTASTASPIRPVAINAQARLYSIDVPIGVVRRSRQSRAVNVDGLIEPKDVQEPVANKRVTYRHCQTVTGING